MVSSLIREGLMRSLSRSVSLVVGVSLAWATSASAVRVPGSPAKAGCYAVFDVEGGSASGKKVTCSDCDASCDIGGPAGQADGQCVFMVRYCLNDTTAAPACKAAGIQKVRAPLLLPGSLTFPAPSTDTDCSAATPITVKLKKKGKKPGKRVVTLLAQAVKGTKPKTERGQLVLVCTPHTTGACPTTSTTSTTTTTTCLPPTGGGGGVACANNPAGGPRELDMVDSASGGDLDNGTTGISHNFPIPQGATLKYCLSDCDGASQPVCQASGPTGKGSLNGETFGPPLPLFSSNVPVCVVNRFADPVNKAVVNVQTGIFDATTTPVHLKSDVYLTNQPPEDVCPICTGSGVGATGTCDSGPNRGKSCTVEGIVIVNNPPSVVNEKYTHSSSYPPDPAQFKATLDITLPLTNDPAKPSTLAANAAGSFPCPGQTQHDECGGTACNVDCSATPPVQGGVNQLCCASDGTTPCFPTSPASGSKPIVRTGAASPPTPSWVPNQTPSATAATNVRAATCCEAASGSSCIDTTAGLAGPGALLLSGTATFVGNTATNTPPTCSTPTTSTTTATTTTTTTTSTTTTTVFSCAPSTPVACMGGSTAFTKVMFAQGQG